MGVRRSWKGSVRWEHPLAKARCLIFDGIPMDPHRYEKYRLARMSDGHYCLVRDLGPLKGGKGLKHHDVIVDFTLRGIVKFSTRSFVKPKGEGIVHRPHESKLFHLLRSWLGVRKRPG